MKFSLFLILFMSALNFICCAADHKFIPVATYEEFTSHGLEAKISFANDGTPCVIMITTVDKSKPLPDWMQAFYFAPANAQTAQSLYQFNGRKPDRVGVLTGFSKVELEGLAIISESLGEGETFLGKKYLAISLKDLLKWQIGSAEKGGQSTDLDILPD